MSEPGRKRPERVLTPALVVFLTLVAGILVFSAVQRWTKPSLEAAVRELADGDLDGPDRPRVLRVVVEAAAASSEPRALWAGLLAAVALADREAYDRALARLGGGQVPTVVPGPESRTFLDLGDPILANLAAALWAEAAGDPAAARRRWQQVRAQSVLAERPLADELAAAALSRL